MLDIPLFYVFIIITVVGSTPLILDLIVAFFPKFPLRIPARQAGVWLLSMLVVLSLMIVYVWYTFFLPFYVYANKPGYIRICMHALTCSFLVFRSLYHMYASHKVSTTIPQNLPIRDERKAHFCRDCNALVFKHDHHCPFVANCIGYKNQRHFLMFVFFLWLGDLYAIHMSWQPFYHCWWNFEENGTTDLCVFIAPHKGLFVLASWAIVPISWLFFWQLFVCYTNTGTREIIQQLRKLEPGTTWQMQTIDWLKKGSLGNFQSVVGASGWLDFFIFPWMSPDPTFEFVNNYRN